MLPPSAHRFRYETGTKWWRFGADRGGQGVYPRSRSTSVRRADAERSADEDALSVSPADLCAVVAAQQRIVEPFDGIGHALVGVVDGEQQPVAARITAHSDLCRRRRRHQTRSRPAQLALRQLRQTGDRPGGKGTGRAAGPADRTAGRRGPRPAENRKRRRALAQEDCSNTNTILPSRPLAPWLRPTASFQSSSAMVRSTRALSAPSATSATRSRYVA